MTENIITVHEQYDAEGDIVWAVALRTYSRFALDKLAELTGAELIFAPTAEMDYRSRALDEAASAA